jgi:hypothetical protein
MFSFRPLQAEGFGFFHEAPPQYILQQKGFTPAAAFSDYQ